jgi:hypothetical protein|tara:strand:+ start:684 stop:887 length:204 start_codon:yes stop_codon:yes gene_type:complete
MTGGSSEFDLLGRKPAFLIATSDVSELQVFLADNYGKHLTLFTSFVLVQVVNFTRLEPIHSLKLSNI